MKIFNIVETENEPVNWENKKSQGTEDDYNRAVKQEAAYRHQREVFTEKLKPYEDLVVKSWNGLFTVPILYKIKGEYMWWGIPKGTPNAEELWRSVKFYIERAERARKLMGKYQRLVSKLKKKHRAETFNDLKSKSPYVNINSADVPRKIYYTATNYFGNPYWDREDVINRYAGPAAHYPKMGQSEHITLVELEKALRKFGLPGMTKLYGCSIKNGRFRPDNRFVAFGADGRLIWKHVRGNVIYIDGKKVPITKIINVTTGSADEVAQRDYLEPLKTPK